MLSGSFDMPESSAVTSDIPDGREDSERRGDLPNGDDKRKNGPANAPNWGLRWGVLVAILVYAAAQLVAIVLWGIADSLAPHLHGSTDWLNATWAQFVYVAASEALGLGVVWKFLRWRDVSWRAIGVDRPKYRDVIIALWSFGSYFLLYAAVVGIATRFIHLDTTQQQDVGFNATHGAPQLALAFVSLVLLPPIVEEITFRGVLFSGLRNRLHFIPAALFTSALFAAPHLLEAKSGGTLWIAGLDTFVLSLVLCYVRERTGRIWAGVGVHTLKNAIAFASLFLLASR